MIPVQQLLQRIRWDPEFGRADFAIGYYDRVTGNIVRVPFSHVQFEPGDHFSFTAVEADGSVHEVPLHRIREVLRNGVVIWQRPAPEGHA
jgi:uncharacterized protein (UPF0248 family)